MFLSPFGFHMFISILLIIFQKHGWPCDVSYCMNLPCHVGLCVVMRMCGWTNGQSRDN